MGRLTPKQSKQATAHMKAGKIVAIRAGKTLQNYAMCGDCGWIVHLNKPLLRSLHWCKGVIKKITPKLDKQDGLQQKQESSTQSQDGVGDTAESAGTGSGASETTEHEPERTSIRYPKCTFCGERI